MSVILEIRDGDPWWASPDVRVVPGDDPDGPAGPPIAGSPAYVWARVSNTGETSVSDATVRFYWANPSIGFDRTTATPIGTAFVTLAPGESEEVLCLTPWVPVFVNEGHECLLAEAFHPSLDPLPATPAFNVPTDRHVAQLNVSVVQALKRHFHLAFEVHNPSRREQRFAVIAHEGKVAELAQHLKWLAAIPNLHAAKVAGLGFLRTTCPDTDEIAAAKDPKADVSVGPMGRAGLTLAGRLGGNGAALIHVEQRTEDRVTGGLSVLVIAR